MTWEEVVNDDRYLNSTKEKQAFIQNDWFKTNIETKPQYTPEQHDVIWNDVFGYKPRPERMKPTTRPDEIPKAIAKQDATDINKFVEKYGERLPETAEEYQEITGGRTDSQLTALMTSFGSELPLAKFSELLMSSGEKEFRNQLAQKNKTATIGGSIAGSLSTLVFLGKATGLQGSSLFMLHTALQDVPSVISGDMTVKELAINLAQSGVLGQVFKYTQLGQKHLAGKLAEKFGAKATATLSELAGTTGVFSGVTLLDIGTQKLKGKELDIGQAVQSGGVISLFHLLGLPKRFKAIKLDVAKVDKHISDLTSYLNKNNISYNKKDLKLYRKIYVRANTYGSLDKAVKSLSKKEQAKFEKTKATTKDIVPVKKQVAKVPTKAVKVEEKIQQPAKTEKPKADIVVKEEIKEKPIPVEKKQPVTPVKEKVAVIETKPEKVAEKKDLTALKLKKRATLKVLTQKYEDAKKVGGAIQKAYRLEEDARALGDFAKVKELEKKADELKAKYTEPIKKLKQELKDIVSKKPVELHAGIPIKQMAKVTKDFRDNILQISEIEPAKKAQTKVGKPLVAKTFKILNSPEYQRATFDKQKIDNTDKTFADLERFFGHFSKKERDAFNSLIYAQAKTPVGKAEAVKRMGDLPKQLRDKELAKNVKKISEYVNKYRHKVFSGKDIADYEDYFYGNYKNPDKVKAFIGSYKKTERYNRQKTVPTIADALGFGLELKNNNLVANLRQELSAIAFYDSMDKLQTTFRRHKGNKLYMQRKLPDNLERVLRATSKGQESEFLNYGREFYKEKGSEKLSPEKKLQMAVTFWYTGYEGKIKGATYNQKIKALRKEYDSIIEKKNAGWVSIDENTFKGHLYEPSLAKYVNNLLSVNKISMSKTLRALRNTNRLIQGIKFVGSAFHQGNVSIQSIADTRIKDMLGKKSGFVAIAKSFKKLPQPEKDSQFYKRYTHLGGTAEKSLQAETQRKLANILNSFDHERAKVLRGEGKQGKALVEDIANYSVAMPFKYVNWLFSKYIPNLKYYKTLYEYSAKKEVLGRELKDHELQEIIKEGQNFYGMMNEALFGRSGTMISGMRLAYLAPGYAEGNIRTILEGVYGWEKDGVRVGGRSRRNIINALLIKATLATIGTIIMTGKPPDKPENWTDLEDLWKVDTGQLDKNDNKIMVDLRTFDKDYYRMLVNPAMQAMETKDISKLITVPTEEAGKRAKGMLAPTVHTIVDMVDLARGRKIYDWKNEEIVNVEDDKLQRILKITGYELNQLTKPYVTGNIQQAINSDADSKLAIVVAMIGLRFSKNKETKDEYKILGRIYELSRRKIDLYGELKRSNDPQKMIDNYNKAIESLYTGDVMNSYNARKTRDITKEQLEEDKQKLLIDTDKHLSNRIGTLTADKTYYDTKESKKVKDYLAKFGIKNYKDAREYLNKYFKEKHSSRNTRRKKIVRLKKIYK